MNGMMKNKLVGPLYLNTFICKSKINEIKKILNKNQWNVKNSKYISFFSFYGIHGIQ